MPRKNAMESPAETLKKKILADIAALAAMQGKNQGDVESALNEIASAVMDRINLEDDGD